MGAHWDTCVSRATRYASTLKARADRGEINESCIDGVMRSFLGQPAYYPEWREKLLAIAMQRSN